MEKDFNKKILNVADKYADLLEQRLDKALKNPVEVTADELKDIDVNITMLNSLVTSIYKLAFLEQKISCTVAAAQLNRKEVKQ